MGERGGDVRRKQDDGVCECGCPVEALGIRVQNMRTGLQMGMGG